MPARTQLEQGTSLLQRTLRRRQVTQERGLRWEVEVESERCGWRVGLEFGLGFALAWSSSALAAGGGCMDEGVEDSRFRMSVGEGRLAAGD